MPMDGFADTQGYLSPEEVDNIIQHIDDVRDRTIYIFLYNSGCRVSEMLGVTTDDIDFVKKTAHIMTLKRKRKKDGKRTKKWRYIPMSTPMNEQLKYYLRWMASQYEVKEYHGPLFTITRQTVYNIVRKRAENVGMMRVGSKPVHPHTLRHSFAVNYLKVNKEDIRTLQMMLGHDKIETTKGYLQFTIEDLADGIKKAFG